MLPRSDPSPALDFTLAAFNVFLRWRAFPIFLDGQRARSDRISSYLARHSLDAIALCELFDGRCRERVLERLRPVFPYRTRLVGWQKGGLLRGNGGVMVLSRWPIEADAETVFDPPGHLDERFVNKGAVYARIVKNGQPVHVFALHANARRNARDVRRRQFEALRSFMRARDLPPEQPVLIAGDFNVHRDDGDEYSQMLQLLEADHPETRGHDSTYDPRHNRLAGGRAERLFDYVLFSRRHRRPLASENEIARPLGPDWRVFPWQAGFRDLSDHYPVIGRFRF